MSSLFRDMFADTDTTLCQFGGSSSSTDRGAVARPTSDFESSLKLQHYPQVAEAIVSLTAIRERARVELARLGQMGATERCWISETERTKREACWSETYKACSKERELTNRTAIEATKDVQKHKASVAGEVAIQMQKSRSSLWDALTSWPATIGAHLVLATMLGQRLLSQSKMTLKVSARSLVLALLLLLIAVRSGLGLLMAKYSAVQGFKLGKFVIWRLLVPQSLQGQNRVRNDLPAPLADLAVKPPAAGDAAAAATEEATTAATATTAPAAAGVGASLPHLAVAGKREPKHLPLFGLCMPPWRSGRQMLTWCVSATLSYVVVGVMLAFLGIVLLIIPAHGQVRDAIWMGSCILLSASQAFAIMGLATLAVNVREEISLVRPYGKFLSVKFVVFFAFWQGMLLNLIGKFNAFEAFEESCGAAAAKTIIQNFLICLEMLAASIGHYYVFPPHDYLKLLAQHRIRHGDCNEGCLEPPPTISEVVDMRDIFSTARQVHRVKIVGDTTGSPEYQSRQKKDTIVDTPEPEIEMGVLRQ